MSASSLPGPGSAGWPSPHAPRSGRGLRAGARARGQRRRAAQHLSALPLRHPVEPVRAVLRAHPAGPRAFSRQFSHQGPTGRPGRPSTPPGRPSRRRSPACAGFLESRRTHTSPMPFGTSAPGAMAGYIPPMGLNPDPRSRILKPAVSLPGALAHGTGRPPGCGRKSRVCGRSMSAAT